MALTQEDLQAISTLLDVKLEKNLEPIKTDLQEVKQRMTNVEADLHEVKQRVTRVEAAQETMQADLQEVKQRVTKVEATQETIVMRNIKLLAEGHGDVVRKLEQLDTLTEKVEDIQDTVTVLKYITVKKAENTGRS